MAIQRFYYDASDVEDMCMYKSGGYHPVHLGDILPKKSTSKRREPRYRIMQKLGHGSYATVWLAKDMLGPLGYVAVKINVSRITGENNEVQILRWLKESGQSDHPGYGNVISLLDDFTIKGPNGTHDCLVTEVVVDMNTFKYTPTFQAHVKEISLQTVMGLSYLHDLGVTHGDLHSGNLGVSIPQLKNHSEKSIMEYFSNPECVVVVARNPEDQIQSLPAYLVPTISLMEYLESKADVNAAIQPLCLKILDLGNSFRKSDKRPPPNTPIYIRAPEVAFWELSEGKICADWNQPVDVWAAACALYELNFGGDLLSGMSNVNYILHRTLQLAGPLPPAWGPYWDLNEFCAKTGKSQELDPDGYWAKERGYRRKSTVPYTERDTDLLVDLLRCMLKVHPDERPPIKAFINHPWFSEKLIAKN